MTTRQEKMPTKVFYNLDSMLSSEDPRKNIVAPPAEKHRVARVRSKLNPATILSPNHRKSSNHINTILLPSCWSLFADHQSNFRV